MSADRCGETARAQADLITSEVTKIVATTVDTAGPIRDRLVALADGLGDLRIDAATFADTQDQATFVKVVDDVTKSWSLLRDLQSRLKDDAALDATITRGSSMKIQPATGNRALVTVGPFADEKEAAQTAEKLGTDAHAAGESPFVVRIIYPDRATAEAALPVLRKKGYTPILVDQTRYAFTRSGTVPDKELWREPDRFIPTHAGARTVALSSDASLVAAGSDDGFVAVYTLDGVLRALPQMDAGVNRLVFTDDDRFLMGGGQSFFTWVMPHPNDSVGAPMRLEDAAQSAVFVPKAYVFAASSRGNGGGLIGGRTPDGRPLTDPFPIHVGKDGAYLAASDKGELFIAMQVPEGFEVRSLLVGKEIVQRGILRIPGTGVAFAVDHTGTFGAAVTDRGTYRFSLKAQDPSATITQLTTPVRDVRFAADGSLYLLDAQRFVKYSAEGGQDWSSPLVDGRRLVIGARPVVLDGTQKLVAFSPKDGTADALAPVGQIQDLAVSRDGKWIAVIADAWRAVLFRIQ